MYQLRGFQGQDTNNGCDAERSADTLVDAKRQARYMLSDDYRRASEAADTLVTVQIWKGAALIAEIA
jgi:hypothetical protein